MDQPQALSSFAALSEETRLDIVRALVVAGPDGLAAGVIAERMGVSATNVSFHLKELERSGLISQRRESRSIIYSASYETLADLVQFLRWTTVPDTLRLGEMSTRATAAAARMVR